MWPFSLFKKKSAEREEVSEMHEIVHSEEPISKDIPSQNKESNAEFRVPTMSNMPNVPPTTNQVSIKPEVDQIIATFESGNIPLLQNRLFHLCNKLNKPGSGVLITSYPEKDRLCEVFNMCLQYDWMNDSDIREVWAENAFYCISEYFKTAKSKQDYFAAALDLFLTCAYGGDSLLTKFDDILSKARLHPLHCNIFSSEEYQNGADYLVKEFAFFGSTIISPIVRQHPGVISSKVLPYYENAKSRFEYATIPPDQIFHKMNLISSIIGSILNDM